MDVIVKVRDPDENLEEKIKAYKVKKRIKTAVTILAFVFALISSYLLVKLQTYTSLRTLQSYKNKETESSDFEIFAICRRNAQIRTGWNCVYQ